MAVGTSLASLREMLKAEARLSTNAAVGVGNVPTLDQLLRRTQTMLYDEYDWPHLQMVTRKTLQSGQRFYDPPPEITVDRIDRVTVWYSSMPHTLERGIGADEYAAYDSAAGEKTDPVLKWDLRWTGSATQIEVWPVPVGDDMFLEFIGPRKLNALVADDDRADLDDYAIVLFAAAEILGAAKSEDAQLKLQMAQKRINVVRGRLTGGSRPTIIGGKTDSRPTYQTVVRVR